MLVYFDCFYGISGDMILGALIDLGVPLKYLEDRLNSIPFTDFDITLTPVQPNGIKAMLVIVGIYDDQKARNFADIRSLIENCPLSEKIKTTSLQNLLRIITGAQSETATGSPGGIPEDHISDLDKSGANL
jgi:hypothetical protein